MDDYADEFERLHCLFKLGEKLDFNCFVTGLRSSILKNMKEECKDMHEAFW